MADAVVSAIESVAGSAVSSVVAPAASMFSPYLLLAAVAALAIAFGGGFWLATSQAENKLVAAATEAYDSGTKAQQAFDAGQMKKAQADFQARLAANTKRNAVVASVEQAVHPVDTSIASIVPQQQACTVSADAMKRLNDLVAP